MPEWKIVANHSGKFAQKSGDTTGIRPNATAAATITMLLVLRYSTEASVRMPLAATVPNSTIPAPPSTGCGIAENTADAIGESPSTSRSSPPAATANRLRIPVSATRPTFWANAVAGKELNTGASAEAAMSARRPSPTRRESTSAPTTSPTARMSAVVSTMTTRMTMTIDTIAPISNSGPPNANGVGMAATLASPTFAKLLSPRTRATTVPTSRPSSTESRETTRILLATITTRKVNAASAMFGSEANAGLGTVAPATVTVSRPVIHPVATGISDSPMTVMIDPVTTGGNSRTTFAKNGEMSSPTSAATITAPKTTRRPSVPSSPTIAIIVDTEAKEVP